MHELPVFCELYTYNTTFTKASVVRISTLLKEAIPQRGVFKDIHICLANLDYDFLNQMNMTTTPIRPAAGESLPGHGKFSSALSEDNGRMKG